jgi:hypothetical protein
MGLILEQAGTLEAAFCAELRTGHCRQITYAAVFPAVARARKQVTRQSRGLRREQYERPYELGKRHREVVWWLASC